MKMNNEKGTVVTDGRGGLANPGPSASARLSPAAFLLLLAVSAVAAVAASHTSFSAVIGLIMLALALGATFNYPRVALFVFLLYTSSILAPEHFYYYVDPNFVYWGAELFLLVLVAGAIRQRVREAPGAFHDYFTSPVAVSLTVLGSVISIKSIVFLVEMGFPQWAFSHVYTFNRSLGFFALFVPVFLLFNNSRRQRLFFYGLYGIGVFVALRVLLEAVMPDLAIFEWIGLRQALAVEFPSVDPTVLRLRAPGGSIVQICFWLGMMNLVLRPWSVRRLALLVPVTLLMLTVILLEFNRSYVIPILGLMVVAMLLNQRGVRLKLAGLLGMIGVGLVLFSIATGTTGSYVDAISERYSSAFAEETFTSLSLSSRNVENDYAWQSIRREPVFGIGIAELYRPPIPGMLDNLRWYIHNAYLWYWVYFGFIGLAALLIAVAVAVVRGFFSWRQVSDPFLQAGLLALVFTLLTLSAASFYAPRFYEYGTVPVIAVTIGMIEAIVAASRRARLPGGEPAESAAAPEGGDDGRP
ncbi:MAG: O-antigen ligase domain-containing protein [Gaiellales bacterium]|nr:MAG: O-antigen ligase domain-containing protein [Gaiellales bacterium]